MKKIFCLVALIIFTLLNIPDNKVAAETFDLECGCTYHYEDLTEGDLLCLPMEKYRYDVTIENVKLKKKDGSITTEYNKYIGIILIEEDEYEDYYYKEIDIYFKENKVTFSPKDCNRFFWLSQKPCIVFSIQGLDDDETAQLSDDPIICDISISEPELPDLSKMKLSKTDVSCYLSDIEGKSVKLKKAVGKTSWSISNKKIVRIYKEGNEVMIYPKKIGKCFLIARCSGRTFKCKITVKGKKNLYAGGILDSYSTRSNVFVMRFKNCSKKNITILANGGVAVDSDYQQFDRNVRLKKSVCVKPGQEKKIKFYVIGPYTWYDVDDFCINYTVKYSGKNYRMASDAETTWVRKNGKWEKMLTYDMIGHI